MKVSPALPYWLSVALFVLPVNAGAQQVTRVIDGDTLVVDTIGTVRLIGVDTPETVDPRKPVQAFGAEASAFLKGLALGKSVKLDFDQTRTDRYGRTLAYAYLPDGTFVNREIIRQGYGFAYTEFPFRLMDDFRAAERDARAAHRGMWADAKPDGIHPQVFINDKSEVYHLQACRHVTPDSRPMVLADAAKTHRACKVCKPPTP